MTKDQLLAVLDMTEDEQLQWLIDNKITDGSLAVSQVTGKIVPHWIRIELADLAFRLRDDADKIKYGQAIVVVQNELVRLGKLSIYHQKEIATNEYKWIFESKPIHWVIASLIAKAKVQ